MARTMWLCALLGATAARASGMPSYTARAPLLPEILVSRTSGLRTTEGGGYDTFEVALTTRPTSRVTVELRSSDPTEGKVVRPLHLVYNPWPNPAWQTWSTVRTVTVVGVDDRLADGDKTWTVETSVINTPDADYGAMDPPDVEVVNEDDDAFAPCGVRVVGLPVDGVLETTEAGGEASFGVVLTCRPEGDVMIDIFSSDTTEGVPQPQQPLWFHIAPDDWDRPVRVVVRGVDDDVEDGDVAYQMRIKVGSGDPAFKNLVIPPVDAVNLDDDVADILVSRGDGLVTTEAGGSDTFMVKLTSRPTSRVTVELRSSDPTEGKVVRPLHLVYNPWPNPAWQTWSTVRTVTVVGVDDRLADGDKAWTVETSVINTPDPLYAGLDPADVGVVNEDDDAFAPYPGV